MAKLLPMLFAAMTLTIVDAVATVANNINSNNNNNNNQVYVTVWQPMQFLSEGER